MQGPLIIETFRITFRSLLKEFKVADVEHGAQIIGKKTQVGTFRALCQIRSLAMCWYGYMVLVRAISTYQRFKHAKTLLELTSLIIKDTSPGQRIASLDTIKTAKLTVR